MTWQITLYVLSACVLVGIVGMYVTHDADPPHRGMQLSDFFAWLWILTAIMLLVLIGNGSIDLSAIKQATGEE